MLREQTLTTPTMSFKNKVVIITGASSGIGAATAVLFAKDGANVVMVGRNMEKLDKVAAEVNKVGKKPLVITADVANDEDAKRVIRETVEQLGKIDVLVNNAGLARYGTILEGTVLESYDGMFNVNVRAVIHLTTLAAPHLVKTKGNIINISSAASLLAFKSKKFNAYSVSKAAVDRFTKNAASELAAHGVRVNCINPGPVKSDFFENSNNPVSWEMLESLTALKRVSSSEEIADVVLFVASDKAKSITGSCVVVDNGHLVCG